MALHKDLPIYRTGVSLVRLAFEIQRVIPRGFKRTLGEQITGHCTSMINLMALSNASRGQQRATYISELLRVKEATDVLLRICFDMQFISRKLWAAAIQLLDSIGRQGGAWFKSARSPQPAPAA